MLFLHSNWHNTVLYIRPPSVLPNWFHAVPGSLVPFAPSRLITVIDYLTGVQSLAVLWDISRSLKHILKQLEVVVGAGVGVSRFKVHWFTGKYLPLAKHGAQRQSLNRRDPSLSTPEQRAVREGWQPLTQDGSGETKAVDEGLMEDAGKHFQYTVSIGKMWQIKSETHIKHARLIWFLTTCSCI